MLACFLVSCADFAARAPNPVSYQWPESLIYHIDHVPETPTGLGSAPRVADSRRLILVRRDALYLAWHDNVPGIRHPEGAELAEPAGAPPPDTMRYYLRLDRRGGLLEVQPDCDPAVPACAAALPSTLRLGLRRIVPRLPVWPAPRGGGWVDTLVWDDALRPGWRGTLVTRYGAARDTVIAGRAYWMVAWASAGQAVRQADPGGPAATPAAMVEEGGVSWVDKRRLLPVFAEWGAAVGSPAQPGAIGAAGGFRSRAYLAGTYFDSVLSRADEPRW